MKMRHLPFFRTPERYILLSLLLIICGCSSTHTPTDFTEDLYSPSYSSNFTIKGSASGHNSLITVFNPWQGAKDVSTSLLILRDSVAAMEYSGQVLKGTPQRIVCMSSTHIAMLDALGAIDKVAGVSGKQYVSNPYIQNHPEIPDVGYEGNIDYEALIAAKPDLVLLFSVSGTSGMEPKLKELGIPFIYIGDYLEEDPLGKTEWMVALAEILGIREEGVEKFKEIERRYNTLKDRVADAEAERPAVMVNAPFADAWFMPSSDSYVAKMIEDAGGAYVYDKNTGNSSEPIDMEEALKLTAGANVWINIGTVSSLAEFQKSFPKFANTNCVKNGNLYNNNLRSTPGGGNDCYESGVVNPDIVLRDMVKIFHPNLVEEDFVYYHQLK